VRTAGEDALDLSVPGPLDGLPDDGAALDRHPALREFRSRLGSTPLVEVPSPAGGATILAKLESANPFGSVKDRAAYALFCGAVTEHGDRPEPLRLVDFSGGNMARALGGLGALTGIPVRLAVPDSIPPSLLRQLEADHAQLDFVPAERFLHGIIRRAAEIAAADPGLRILHQHRNPLNVAVHEFMTGPEILGQLDGRAPGHWVAAIGTGGTIAGVARALRRHGGTLSVVGITPDEMPYGTAGPPDGRRKFPGSGGLGYGMRQPFVDGLLPDASHRTVSYPEALAAMTRFRGATGMAIGASAAASWLTAYRLAETLGADQVVLTVFADAGTREDWERAEELAG
jgi:cysteine synthase